jgi:hypothetical protein
VLTGGDCLLETCFRKATTATTRIRLPNLFPVLFSSRARLFYAASALLTLFGLPRYRGLTRIRRLSFYALGTQIPVAAFTGGRGNMAYPIRKGKRGQRVLFILSPNGLVGVVEGYMGYRTIILQKTVDRQKKGVALVQILDQRLGPPIWVWSF